MKTQRKQLLIKTTAWVIAEIVLNLAGLDNLADYSEFIFDQNLETASAHPTITTSLIIDQLVTASLFA